jgi:hypothetical protein
VAPAASRARTPGPGPAVVLAGQDGFTATGPSNDESNER